MGNHRLQTLIIPDNVNYIGEAAFSDCLVFRHSIY